MPTPAENALPTSDRRHTHTRGGSTGGGSGDLCCPDPRGDCAASISGCGDCAGSIAGCGDCAGSIAGCGDCAASISGCGDCAASISGCGDCAASMAGRGDCAASVSGRGDSAASESSDREPSNASATSASPIRESAILSANETTRSTRRGRDTHLPPRTRRILHVDVDAFLASVEQAVHPELRDLPVVIGGMPTDRNLVMSCSYPARAFGVKPGMLLPEAYRRCPHAIFRRGDSQAAKRLRESVAHILMRATPIVEIASIDDFFVDLTGTTRALGDAFDVAERARDQIRTELSLPVTIGIGTSRLLARIAGKLAKPAGIAEIFPGHERAFLARLPVEHLPGAGHVIGRMLERFGITRVGEIALVSREIMFASFGSMGLVLHERALGLDPTPIEATYTQDSNGAWIERLPKTVRRDSTFEPEEGRREIVDAMFAYLVERATHLLRKHKAVARSIAVRVQYVDTRPKPTDRPREANPELEKRVKLSEPTASTDVIARRVIEVWRALPRRRALVKRVGITLVDLTRSSGIQRSLFDDGPSLDECDAHESRNAERGAVGANDPSAHDETSESADRSSSASETSRTRESRADRQRRLDDALDTLRAKHGFGRIMRGSSFLLKENHELGEDGFRLRTPSLNQ